MFRLIVAGISFLVFLFGLFVHKPALWLGGGAGVIAALLMDLQMPQ